LIKLRIRDPETGATDVVVDGNIAVIGRGSGEVKIPHQGVSHAHAVVVAGLAVVDLSSTNGVWVDGQRIKVPKIITPETNVYLGGDTSKSPSFQVLETAMADDGKSEEIQRLRQQVASLELEVDRLRVEAESNSPGSTIPTPNPLPSEPDPGAPAHEATAEHEVPLPPTAPPPPAASPAPPPEPEPAAPDPGALPNFAEFFGSYQAAPPAPAPATPGAPPQPRAQPVPAHQVAHGSSANRQAVLDMIDRLVREDVTDISPLMQGPVEQFFTMESFRLLRQVEKVISRVARDFVQLYEMKTMLPGEVGNFRSLSADVLVQPDDPHAREKLVKYLEELSRWLGVSLVANRHSALKFVHEVRRELGREALTQGNPIPKPLKMLGQEHAELWRRAERYLTRLTNNVAEDRLEDYVREFVTENHPDLANASD
jgi:hypothetical protein